MNRDQNDGQAYNSAGYACYMGTGGAAIYPSEFSQGIEVTVGQTYTLYLDDSFKGIRNCQGQRMTTTTIWDETGSQTTNANNSFITFDAGSTPPYIKVNAAYAVPSVRWFHVYTKVNEYEERVYLQIIIYPALQPSAIIEKPSLQCPSNDAQYPRVIGGGGYQQDTYIQGAVIDEDNGNLITCGLSHSQIMKVKYYQSPDAYQSPWIAMFDLNGLLQWGFSASTIQLEHSRYQDCGFSTGQTGVFGLIFHLTSPNMYLYLSKHDYVTGKILYLRLISSWYQNTLDGNFFKIDKQFNHMYIASKRVDVDPGNTWEYTLTKVDISRTYPVQQYYGYCLKPGQAGYQYGITSMQILHDQDSVAIKWLQYFDQAYYATVALLAKSNGAVQASKSIYMSTSAMMFSDIVTDGNNLFLGYTCYNPKEFYLTKMSMPTLAVQGTVFHSYLDGYDDSIISLTNDTNYIYAFHTENAYLRKYLTKFQKSDLAILQAVYPGCKIAFNIYFQDYDERRMGVVTKFNLVFQTPSSCLETYPHILNRQGFYTANQRDYLAVNHTVQVQYGEFQFQAIPKLYFEYWGNMSLMRMYDADYLKCKYYAPRFSQELETQIITIPDSKSYTFDWPVDCFQSQLVFTWSVDLFTQATKPSFLSFTNDSSTSTLTMSPSASDIGTYVVRVRFAVQGKLDSFTESTIVVEVYPEKEYGKEPIECPTPVYMTTFWKGHYDTTDWNMMDMDFQGLNFIICGRSSQPDITRNPSVAAGFLQSNTIGLDINFFITIQSSKSTTRCYSYFGYNSMIHSVFNLYDSGAPDTILMMRHSPNGKFNNGRQLALRGSLYMYDYQIDISSGDQYFTGVLYQTQLSKDSQSVMYVLKIDRDYNYVFMKHFGDQSVSKFDFYGRAVRFTDTQIFLMFQYNVGDTFNWPLGSLAFSNVDGQTQWKKALFYSPNLSSAYLERPDLTSYSPLGMTVYNGYLYEAFSYFTNGATNGDEYYLIKLDLITGAVADRQEYASYQPSWQNQVMTLTLVGSPTQADTLIMSWGVKDIVFMSFFTTTANTLALKTSVVIDIYYPSGLFNFRVSLVERNGMMYGFSKLSASMDGGQNNHAFIFRFNDYTTAKWKDNYPTCSIIFSDPEWMGRQQGPTGLNGDIVKGYWQDFPSSYLIQDEVVRTKNFMRYYTNIQNVLMYPISNSSVNTKTEIANCKYLSRPIPPTSIPARIGDPINSTSGGFSVMAIAQSMQLPPFKQCSGIEMLYTVKYLNGSSLSINNLLELDQSGPYLTIRAYSNIYKGLYTLIYQAELQGNPTYSAQTQFQIEILPNKAPTAKLNFTDPVQIYSHHNYRWTVLYENDTEGDTPSFGVAILDYNNITISSAPYLSIIQSDDTGIIFSIIDPPQTESDLNSQQFYLQVSVWDSFNQFSPNLYNISLKILPNYAPILNPSVIQSFPPIKITQRFSATIWYQNFTDNEGDLVFISCYCDTSSPDCSWINVQVNNTQNSGNITIFGNTPRNNLKSGLYTFTCQSWDQWNESINSYDFTMQVFPKDQIQIIGPFQNYSFRLPQTLSALLASQTFDPLGEPNYYSLYVNNSVYNQTALGSWMFWENSTINISVSPFSNSQGGNHSISIKCYDDITQPQFMNFTIEIIYNWPLVPLVELPRMQGIAFNWVYKDFDKNQIFMDPEGQPFLMYFRERGTKQLPYFLSKNFSNGTLGGYTTDAEVGSYSIECVGVDDALWETVITFIFQVKPCYYKCQLCWDQTYNSCTECKINFYLLNGECLDKCPSEYYQSISTLSCRKCPAPCKTCDGDDIYSQCPSCNYGFYFLNNGCYSKCPNGYYGEKSDFTCRPCHSACSSCYGASSKQCFSCNDLYEYNEFGDLAKVGYLLFGTACTIPQCIDGQYFQWQTDQITVIKTGKCQKCHSRCRKCVGPSQNDCLQCQRGALYDSLFHNCTYCNEMYGLFINEEFECEDICGDGIIINKECDDGNVISGDGCSNLCQIEFGYACKNPGQPCVEIIPPFFSIVSISSINQVFVQFSEPIRISAPSDISPTNLLVIITGTQSQYLFEWRMINEDKTKLLPDKNIVGFSIILENFQQSMDGSEYITISFNDSSVIKDLNGNQLTDNYLAQIQANPFIYLSPTEIQTAQGGASSMKYTFMSVFSFNLILKLVLNSSMNYLWGLVHALQVFSFLLYLNINFPDNIKMFTQYFQMASGDLDGLNEYMPNISNYIMNEDNVNEPQDALKLPPKFQEDEISPYFIVAYGDKLTIWCFSFMIVLPLVLLMNKVCKRVKLWEDIKGSFFFNSPLRAFMEQYIEIILQIILNTEFIKFKNQDQLIATLFAFFFGVLLLLLPFLAMTIIYSGRKQVHREDWLSQYGMLVEDCNRQSILQLYYYPAFMFQRLMIAGTIVYVYDMPLVQCFLIIVFNILMIIYLISVKPFTEENQRTATVIDEIVIMICVCFFALLYINDASMSLDSKKNLGWIIIVVIMFSVLKNFAIVIYFGILSARKSVSKVFGEEEKAQDSPHTSDEDDIPFVSNNKIFDDEDLDTEKLMNEIQAEKFFQFTTKIQASHSN